MTEKVTYCVGCHSRYNYIASGVFDIFNNKHYCPRCSQLIYETLHKTHKVKSNVKCKYKEVDEDNDVLKKIKEEIIKYKNTEHKILSVCKDNTFDFPKDCCSDIVLKKVLNHHVYHIATTKDIDGEIRVFEVLDVDVYTNKVIGYHVSDEVDSDIIRIGYGLMEILSKDVPVRTDFEQVDMKLTYIDFPDI